MNENNEKIEMHLPDASEGTKAHAGPILAVIIIMLVLIFGGLLLWGKILTEKSAVTPSAVSIVNNEPETPRAEADTQILETLSPSDEISAIQADLESTKLDSIDTDLTALDTEAGTILGQ